MPEVFRTRVRTHWTRPRMELVVIGLLSFYVTYVSYRNLKSQLPFVEGKGHKFDTELNIIDKALFFGHSPGEVLHSVFGDGCLRGGALDGVPVVPAAGAARARGLAHLVAQPRLRLLVRGLAVRRLDAGHDLLLRAADPGPRPRLSRSRYADLPNTGAMQLMTSIQWTRQYYLRDASGSLQSIAGFASLHVAITLLVALMIQYTTTMRWLKIVFWVNACLTAVATLYFGWHYVADDVAGVAIALVSFYVGAWASHQSFARHREPVEERAEEVTTV